MDIISEHNELPRAYSAVLAVIDCHSSNIEITRRGRNIAYTENGKHYIDQNDIVVTCKKPTSLILSWSIPSTRENGDALTLVEIDYYEIHIQCGQDEIVVIIEDPSQTTYKLTDLKSCEYESTIKTVDVDGLSSSPSDPVFSRI